MPSKPFWPAFQAVVHDIGRCAQLKLGCRYRNREIAILSDSQTTIKSKIEWKCLAKLNENSIIITSTDYVIKRTFKSPARMRDSHLSPVLLASHIVGCGNETLSWSLRRSSNLTRHSDLTKFWLWLGWIRLESIWKG